MSELEEERIEVICEKEKVKDVVAAIKATHPYEEIPLEIYQLVAYEPMRRWYEDQTRAGDAFLREAKQVIPKLELKWRTNQAIRVFFVQPSERTLSKYARMLQV